MANYFFEKYRPEICRGLHKWCCEQILRHLRLFRAKKFFCSKIGNFLTFFAVRGHRFLKKVVNYFFKKYCDPEICQKTAQMVLRTNFEAFKVFSLEKTLIFFKICSQHHFVTVHANFGVTVFLEKWPTSFLRDTVTLKYVVESTNGVANNF